MWLEDFSPEIESSLWTPNSGEVNQEISEKYKDDTKQAWAKVAKVHKDEKKAKKYDFLLAGFLVKIIIDKKFDFLLDTLFPTINKWYSSNFVLWILSLIYVEISDSIREVSKKEKIKFEYIKKQEFEEFDDKNINPEIKDRINYWIEDIVDSTTIEYSDLQTQKLSDLLNDDDELLLSYISKIFIFFLKENNINISQNKANNISYFIIWEINKSIKKINVDEI